MLDKPMIDFLREVELHLAVPEAASGVLLATSVVIEDDVRLFYKIPPVEFAEYLSRIWTVGDRKKVRDYINEAERLAALKVPQSYA